MSENVGETAAPARKGGFGSEWFWRVLAIIIFFTVVWILWLLWQITPKSTVNPIVFQIQQSRQSASGQIRGTPAPDQPGEASGGEAAGSTSLSTGAPLDNLKIETELKAPPKAAEPVK